MARDNWENRDKEYPYLSSAGTTHKDAYFEVWTLIVCGDKEIARADNVIFRLLLEQRCGAF